MDVEILRESAFNLARKLSVIRIHSEIEYIQDRGRMRFKASYTYEEVAELLQSLSNEVNNIKY